MPSGAKRRKAAKKKKENEAKHDPLSTNNESQGSEDLKSQDEKGSDGGDVNSPASHNNDNNSNPFNDGAEEEDEQRDPPINVEATEKFQPENDDGTKKTETDLKSGDDSKTIDIPLEPIESAQEVWNEDKDNKSLNISNPDKESQVIEEKLVDYISVAKSYLYDDKPVDSYPHEKSEETSNLIGETASDNWDNTISVISNGVSSGFKEGEDKSLQVTEELTEKLVDPSDFPLKEIEDKVSPLSSTSVKYEVKVFEPSIDFVPRTRNDAEDVKEIPEHSENELSVTSHPLVARRTSVFSCCGLFDAFTGSK